MKKGLKFLVATLCIGVMVMNTGVVDSKAANVSVGYKNIGQYKVIDKNKRTALVAKEFAKNTPRKADIPFVSPLNAYWCARFAAYCVGDANIINNDSIINSCTVTRNYYRDNFVNKYHSVESGYVPRTGDLVFYNKDNNWADVEHVGIVVDSGRGGSSKGFWIETVEGNYSGSGETDINKTRVEYVSRDRILYDNITGFVTPYIGEVAGYTCGDVDGNGKVTQADATDMLRMIIGNYSCLPNGKNASDACMYFLRADIDCDSNVKQAEATDILRWILNRDMR